MRAGIPSKKNETHRLKSLISVFLRCAPALIFLTALFISGCASSPREPRTVWIKDGASEGDYIQAHGECMAKAKTGNKTNLEYDPAIFIGCMQAKGWQYEKR